MGIRPTEFYELEYEDFISIAEGWNKKQLLEQALLRKHAYIVSASLGLKFGEFNKAWPDPMKPKEETVIYKGTEMSKRMAQKLFEQSKNPTGRTRLERKKRG